MAKNQYEPKKMLTMNILDILERYSDIEHRLSQKDIQDILQDKNNKYQMSVERKAIKRNLMELITAGYPIDYEEIPRSNGSTILTNFYIERDFTDPELKLLIDSVIFSNHIPAHNREELIEKLERLSNIYFRNSTKQIKVANSITSINKSFFLNLEILNEAINNQKKVKFTYNVYKEDKNLHPESEVVVEPYRLIAKNSHYYLICREEPFDNLTHYRVDRITDLTDLEESSSPITSVNLEEYLAEHPYMSSGAAEQIQLRIEKDMIGNVIDWFGDNFRIDKTDDKKPVHLLDIRLKANPDDLYYWALQYGNYVEVKAPQELRDRIRATVQSMRDTYLQTREDKHNQIIQKLEKQGMLDLSRPSYYDPSELKDRTTAVKGMKLDLDLFDDYSFIKDYPNLKKLSLKRRWDAEGRIDFTFLKDLTNLTELWLFNTSFDDLSTVQKLPLKSLGLQEKSIKNLELLYEMPTLERLLIDKDLAYEIDIPHLRETNPKIKIMQKKAYRYE